MGRLFFSFFIILLLFIPQQFTGHASDNASDLSSKAIKNGDERTGEASEVGQSERKGSVAIVNGKVYTMTGEVIERGTVVVENGRITGVGKDLKPPAGIRTIDAAGKIVMPGMIDAGTYMGLQEVQQVDVTNDYDERTDPIVPQVRVIDGIYPDSAHIAVTRINGITSVLSEPGNANAIAGQSAFIHLDGNTLDEMLIKSPIALHLNFGENPKRTYAARNRSPQTRMGTAAVIREAFVKARNYERKLQDYERGVKEKNATPAPTTTEPKPGEPQKPATPPDRDLKMEALLLALSGKIPVIARAERVDDILTAIRLADEFKFRLIISDGAESYKIADQLVSRQIPVLYGPINKQPATMETLGAIYEAAGLLQKAGVKFAIHSGFDGFTEAQSRNLPFMAGFAVAYGLPYQEALKAITIYPAQILGVDKEVGSIEVGKSADLVVFDGDPLEPKSKVLNVFISGREIPLRSYQTDLYERYK